MASPESGDNALSPPESPHKAGNSLSLRQSQNKFVKPPKIPSTKNISTKKLATPTVPPLVISDSTHRRPPCSLTKPNNDHPETTSLPAVNRELPQPNSRPQQATTVSPLTQAGTTKVRPSSSRPTSPLTSPSISQTEEPSQTEHTIAGSLPNPRPNSRPPSSKTPTVDPPHLPITEPSISHLPSSKPHTTTIQPNPTHIIPPSTNPQVSNHQIATNNNSTRHGHPGSSSATIDVSHTEVNSIDTAEQPQPHRPHQAVTHKSNKHSNPSLTTSRPCAAADALPLPTTSHAPPCPPSRIQQPAAAPLHKIQPPPSHPNPSSLNTKSQNPNPNTNPIQQAQTRIQPLDPSPFRNINPTPLSQAHNPSLNIKPTIFYNTQHKKAQSFNLFPNSLTLAQAQFEMESPNTQSLNPTHLNEAQSQIPAHLAQNKNKASSTQAHFQNPSKKPQKSITQFFKPITNSQAQLTNQAQTYSLNQPINSQAQTHNLNQSPYSHITPTQSLIHNPPNKAQNQKNTYASIVNPASILDPDAPPRPHKSFSDAVSGVQNQRIPVKSASLLRGEPAVIFSAEEITAMAEPFKLSLVGKFSFGRPSMDIIRKFFISLGLKGNSQISLMDNRHVLIKLSMEEDYSRIWLRQSWYVNGRNMRIFKWSTDFRCSAESPIVPVWVSLPYLPVHFIHCKAALFSIAAAIGTPLRVDHATASVNRPSVARVLIEYDISRPLLPRIWIGEGESGFWQSVIFERVPAYCSSCKHLGHSDTACFVTNPGLRKPTPATDPPQRSVPDRGKQHVTSTDPIGVAPHPLADDVRRREPGRGDYLVAQSQDSAVQVDTDDGTDEDFRSPIAQRDRTEATMDPQCSEHLVVGFNSHCRDIPSQSDDVTCMAGDSRSMIGDRLHRSDTDISSEDADGEDSYFHTDSDCVRPPLPTDAVIDSLNGERVSTSPIGFTDVIRRKRRLRKRRANSRPIPAR